MFIVISQIREAYTETRQVCLPCGNATNKFKHTTLHFEVCVVLDLKQVYVCTAFNHKKLLFRVGLALDTELDTS